MTVARTVTEADVDAMRGKVGKTQSALEKINTAETYAKASMDELTKAVSANDGSHAERAIEMIATCIRSLSAAVETLSALRQLFAAETDACRASHNLADANSAALKAARDASDANAALARIKASLASASRQSVLDA